MVPNSSPEEHFRAMVWLLGECGELFQLAQHAYHPATFGSFEVVFNRGAKSLRFVWDGKESKLLVYVDASKEPVWIEDARIHLPRGNGVFEEIASELENARATEQVGQHGRRVASAASRLLVSRRRSPSTLKLI